MLILGNHSKITVNTRNVFIECTGTDFTKVNKTFFYFCTVRYDRFYFWAKTLWPNFKMFILKVGTYSTKLKDVKSLWFGYSTSIQLTNVQ